MAAWLPSQSVNSSNVPTSIQSRHPFLVPFPFPVCLKTLPFVTEKELESHCINVLVVVMIPNIISYITLRCNLQPSRNFGGGDGNCESHDAVGLLVSTTLRTIPVGLGGPEQTSFVPGSRSEKQRTYRHNTRTERKDESDSENGEVGKGD